MQSITVHYALPIKQTQFSVCVSSHQLLFNFIEFYTDCRQLLALFLMQLRKFSIVSIAFRWQQVAQHRAVCVYMLYAWCVCKMPVFVMNLWQREMVQVFVRSKIKANHQRNDSITTAVAIEMALNEYRIIQ